MVTIDFCFKLTFWHRETGITGSLPPIGVRPPEFALWASENLMLEESASHHEMGTINFCCKLAFWCWKKWNWVSLFDVPKQWNSKMHQRIISWHEYLKLDPFWALNSNYVLLNAVKQPKTRKAWNSENLPFFEPYVVEMSLRFKHFWCSGNKVMLWKLRY